MDITEICAAIRKGGPLAPEDARQLVATITTSVTDWLAEEHITTDASIDATDALTNAFEELDHLVDALALEEVDTAAEDAELARDRANFAHSTGAADALRGVL